MPCVIATVLKALTITHKHSIDHLNPYTYENRYSAIVQIIMRLSAVYNSVVIASFASNALAKIWFDPVASKLSPGDSLQLKWTTDHDYVRKQPSSKSSMKHSDLIDALESSTGPGVPTPPRPNFLGIDYPRPGRLLLSVPRHLQQPPNEQW